LIKISLLIALTNFILIPELRMLIKFSLTY
jgi:hypothetical protein